MKLEVIEGDIAALEVDAVANAANDRLWMGAGVAGALKRAGGNLTKAGKLLGLEFRQVRYLVKKYNLK